MGKVLYGNKWNGNNDQNKFKMNGGTQTGAASPITVNPSYQAFGYGTGTPTGANGGTWEQKVTGTPTTPTTYAANGYGYDPNSGFAVMPKVASVTGQNTPPTNYGASLTGQGQVNVTMPQPLSDSVPAGAETGTETGTGALQQAYTSAMKNAEVTRDQSKEQARIDYEAAILDAERRYKAAMGNYGQTAESLAASGLAESGYAQYLRDRAYGKKVDEIIAAKGTRAQNERTADNLYSSAITQLEMKKAENQAQTDAKYDSQGVSFTQIDEILKDANNGLLSPEQKTERIKQAVTSAETAVGNNTFFNDPYDETAKISSGEARKLMDKFSEHAPELKQAMQKLYDDTYVVYRDVNRNALGTTLEDFSEAASGEEFNIHYGKAGSNNDLRWGVVKSDKPITTPSVVEAAKAMGFDTSNVTDKVGTLPVFGFAGELYLYYNGDVYRLMEGENGNGDEYNELKNFVFGNEQYNGKPVITKVNY